MVVSVSTYYSFYKKCSCCGLALLLCSQVTFISMAQTSFAADGESGDILSNLDPKAAAEKILGNSGLEEKLHQAELVDPKESLKASKQGKADVELVEGAVEVEAVAEADVEAKELTPAEKIGLKTTSTEFLASFDPNGKRDPFSSMQEAPQEAMPAGDSWWDDSEAPQTQATKDLYFNGQSPANSSASYARLPMIKVTGMMQIGGRSAVTAIIQNKGSCVLYENDRLILNAGQGGNLTKWLLVKKIHSNGMTLMLDDGKEISGKFY